MRRLRLVVRRLLTAGFAAVLGMALAFVAAGPSAANVRCDGRWHAVPNGLHGVTNNPLSGVSGTSEDDVWAVGTIQELNGSILTLTEQFDGATWRVVSSPNPGKVGDLFVNNLNAVASPGSGTVFTVGSKEVTGQCCLRTLALHTSRG